MKKLSLIIIVVVFGMQIAASQQSPLFSNLENNLRIYNPASKMGSHDLSIIAGNRSQWAGLDGAPQSIYGNARIRVVGNVSMGLSILQDKIGPVSNTFIEGSFNYKAQFSDNTALSIGMNIGFQQFNVNLAKLGPTEGNDFVLVNDFNSNVPSFGIGAFLEVGELFISASVPRLLRGQILSEDDIAAGNIYEDEYAYAGIGYGFDFANNIKFTPSAFARVNFEGQTDLDIYMKVGFMDRFEVAPFIRVGDAIGSMFAYNFSENVKVGYAYEQGTTEIRRFTNASHEVFVAFNTNFGKKEGKIPMKPREDNTREDNRRSQSRINNGRL